MLLIFQKEGHIKEIAAPKNVAELSLSPLRHEASPFTTPGFERRESVPTNYLLIRLSCLEAALGFQPSSSGL